MRSELRNFARRFFANVNGKTDRADEGAEHDQCDEPGRNMADSQGAVKIGQAFHRVRRVKKNFRDPCHQDHDENENVITFQSAPDRFEFADFETRQNQILTD